MASQRACGLLALLALWSGCTSSAGLASDSADSSSVQTSEGEGTIEGVVTDDEIIPLHRARIQIVSMTDKSLPAIDLLTDDGGKFVVEGLAVGEYVVYVSKVGYREPAPETVLVGQEMVRLIFLLERLAVQVPFHESVRYQTSIPLMVCAVYPGNFFCFRPYGQFPNQFYTHVVEESQKGLLQSLIIEMRWTPRTPGCPGGMRNNVFAPEAETFTDTSKSNPYHWDSLPRVNSPTRLFIPREGNDLAAMWSAARTQLNDDEPIETSGKWTIVTNPHPAPAGAAQIGFDCAQSQPFENWLTSFYVDPAPSSLWSIFADG